MKWIQGMFLCMALIASFRILASGESSRDHVAAVLFKNFETVVHSSPALISETRPESVTSYERVPFNYMLAGLKALDKREVPAILAHGEEIFVGSKDFLPPAGLGMTRSTRCYVIVLRKGESFDFSKFFKTTSTQRPRSGTGLPRLGNLEIAEIAIFVRAFSFQLRSHNHTF